MATRKEVRNRIASVKNIGKITRAMEMVAAARLRRAEQRIAALRPYAESMRRMTRIAAREAGDVPRVPIIQNREDPSRVGILLITGDRGLAGAFNSSILREGTRLRSEFTSGGTDVGFSVVGRRGESALGFRGYEIDGAYSGFTERPGYANAREIGDALTSAYIDEELDRVEIVYNRYVSPLTQHVWRQTLLPVQQAHVFGEGSESEQDDDDADETNDEERVGALVEYEPEPEELLGQLIPDYVNISLYRALLESSASELGARMTAMRSAAENAESMIDDLTLEMNRVRQAEITQEILEVVSGAEALG